VPPGAKSLLVLGPEIESLVPEAIQSRAGL
jgi:hypothetical protein